jgi:hypothetical protein
MNDYLEEAKKAISAVFSDTSVSPAETKANLEELQDDIDVMIDSLPRD